MPPAPLAAFGIQKMTATQIRRARMNKQMSEDCSQQVINKMNLNISGMYLFLNLGIYSYTFKSVIIESVKIKIFSQSVGHLKS